MPNKSELQEKKQKECACMESTPQKIIDMVKNRPRNPKGFQVSDGDFALKSFYPHVRLYSEFKLQTSFEKKDGTRSREKTETVSMYYTFCPFCGQKYPKQ